MRMYVHTHAPPQGNFESARKKYEEAMLQLGYQADLMCHVALCYYKQKQYGQALKHLGEIIEKGVRDHPELSVGAGTHVPGEKCLDSAEFLPITPKFQR